MSETVTVGYPQRRDISLYDWSSGKVRYNVMNSDGAARDLTGYEASIQVRDNYGGELLLEFTEGNSIATDPTGHIDVGFTWDVIGPAEWSVGFYDLFLKKTATGDYYTVATGIITVANSVGSHE